MLPKKVVMLTIPLFPYLPGADRRPQKPRRIRPGDALDIRDMLKEIGKNELMTLDVAGRPWSVTSVYSSYTPDIHVMLIETNPHRYISGPEGVLEDEGNRLMELWAAILDLIGKRKTVATVHAGYNWSPRAWGKEEEKTGFQSIPTKWHPHLWGWPAFDKVSFGKKWYARVDTASLPPQLRRLLGDNNYALPLGRLIQERMRENFSTNSLFYKLFPRHKWFVDGRGIYNRFNENVADILRAPGFFGLCLKPLAAMLEEIARELTETFTTIECKDIDRILARTTKARPKNWKRLRASPVMRNEKYIRRVFKSRRYPHGLLEALWQPVWDRCHEKSDPAGWWRKGFAYAMVFNGPSKGRRGELRIMPGVFVGPGGVVEAEGFVIRRPEYKKFSDREIQRKSQDLRNLAEGIKTHKT
jgi:hypothetical protein